MKFTFAPEARPLDGYTIKRAIHRGGFGEVYYALSDAGKEVALKLLNNNLDVELRGVTQCLNLKHPNLVTIFDIRQDSEKDHWVVMEYVNGRGLYEALQDHPSGMPVNEVLMWLHGITAGLTFLHDRGIVHRDLKPANVFRDQTAVKIGDVGLSKYISESRRSAQTQSVGTVYYMAPEVARGRYGHEVDVYALGVMLYEMITGTVPFDGQTTAEILMKHLTAEPDVSVLPAELRPVILGALEKDPDKRTRSVEDVERGFRRAVSAANGDAPIPRIASDQAASARHSVLPQRPTETTHVAGFGVETRLEPESQRPASGISTVASLWNSLPAPLQWVIGGAVALLVIQSGMLRTVAFGGMIGGAAYLGYQLLTVLVGESQSRTSDATSSQPTASAVRTQPPLDGRTVQPSSAPRRPDAKTNGRSPRVYTPATLRTMSIRQRTTDISTSISVSLAATAVVTLAVFLTTDLLQNAAQAVYFGTVTMLASCSLIVPSKLWEGRSGDSFTRRLCLGGLGLGVGFVAAVLPKYLLIQSEALFRGASTGREVLVGRVILADGSGIPTVACFMVFFAALFAIRRWWWQVDSFRRSRFRVSSALFTLLMGVIVASLLQQYSFPDSLGATWALAISAVVQLSSGWTPAEDRTLRPAATGPLPSTGQTSPGLVNRDAATLNRA
ncbi:MAG: serine/threonine-protein kinase [Planctomycetaceae bacterium]